MMLKVAVLGAGHGGHAMAGHLALKGFPVRVFNRFEEELIHLRERGGVTLEGAVEGFGGLELVSADAAEVVPWADVIMVVVPAFAHRWMAEACAPHLRDGQVVVLNPGRTGGALEFRSVLRERGVEAQVFVAEAQTLVYACRISGPARVRIAGLKRRVPLAALPASDTPKVLEKVGALYPQFVPAANVLETGLSNIGAVFHPATVLLNANRIEAREEFEFYRGMTPTVARLLEAVDAERLAVARAFGLELDSAADWLLRAYEGVRGETLYERIQSNEAYRGIKAPKSLEVRYVLEDVPTGLVPFASLGELAGVPTPTCRALVDIFCALLGRDFWEEGRTAEKLGLAGMSADEIMEFVNTGVKGASHA